MTKNLTADELTAAREGREAEALESARRRMPLADAFRLVAEARR